MDPAGVTHAKLRSPADRCPRRPFMRAARLGVMGVTRIYEDAPCSHDCFSLCDFLLSVLSFLYSLGLPSASPSSHEVSCVDCALPCAIPACLIATRSVWRVDASSHDRKSEASQIASLVSGHVRGTFSLGYIVDFQRLTVASASIEGLQHACKQRPAFSLIVHMFD